jgi:hypothetical protein
MASELTATLPTGNHEEEIKPLGHPEDTEVNVTSL